MTPICEIGQNSGMGWLILSRTHGEQLTKAGFPALAIVKRLASGFE